MSQLEEGQGDGPTAEMDVGNTQPLTTDGASYHGFRERSGERQQQLVPVMEPGMVFAFSRAGGYKAEEGIEEDPGTESSVTRRLSHISQEFDTCAIMDGLAFTINNDGDSMLLDEFENVQIIGQGGYGKVYRGDKDGKSYALKKVKIDGIALTSEKCRREVEILASLTHKNIVEYHHCWIKTHSRQWLKAKEIELGIGSGESSQESDPDLSASQRSSEASADDTSRPRENFAALVEFSSSSGSPSRYSGTVPGLGSGSKMGYQERRGEETGTDRYLYIQMELCNHGDWKLEVEDDMHSLRGRLLGKDRKKLNVEITFIQLVDAVHYLHGKSVIHRDLKPNNVFFTTHDDIEVLKLGDFGLARFVFDEDRNPIEKFSPALGTQFYMSPEMDKDCGSYTEKTDIYSLGVILLELFYEMNSGQERSQVLENVKKHRIFPNDFRERIHPEVAVLIESMLSVDAKIRPSAEEIRSGPIYLQFARQMDQRR